MGETAQSTVTLRPALVDECAALGELCLSSKGWWGYDAAFLEACRQELSIGEDDIGDLLRVAEVSGAVAGLVQLAQDGNDWHVEKLFVDPPFIGRGVGAALMRWALDAARGHGARRLVIEADPGAVDFYRRFGAVEAGMVASGSIAGRFIPLLVLDLDQKPGRAALIPASGRR